MIKLVIYTPTVQQVLQHLLPGRDLTYTSAVLVYSVALNCSCCQHAYNMCFYCSSLLLHSWTEKATRLFSLQTAGVNVFKGKVCGVKLSLRTFKKHLHYSNSEIVEHVCSSLQLISFFPSSSLFHNPFLMGSCFLDFWYLIMSVCITLIKFPYFCSHCCQSCKPKISSQLQRAPVSVNP